MATTTRRQRMAQRHTTLYGGIEPYRAWKRMWPKAVNAVEGMPGVRPGLSPRYVPTLRVSNSSYGSGGMAYGYDHHASVKFARGEDAAGVAELLAHEMTHLLMREHIWHGPEFQRAFMAVCRALFPGVQWRWWEMEDLQRAGLIDRNCYATSRWCESRLQLSGWAPPPSWTTRRKETM